MISNVKPIQRLTSKDQSVDEIVVLRLKEDDREFDYYRIRVNLISAGHSKVSIQCNNDTVILYNSQDIYFK